MSHRLGVVLIAVMFALSLFAGLGAAQAVASPMSASCYQAVDHMSSDRPSPTRNCGDSAGHSACLVNVSCVAFVVPAAATVLGHVVPASWHSVPFSGLNGASLSTETPPPIASF